MRGHIKEFGIRKGKTHLFPVNSKPHNIWGISAGSICVPTKPSPSLPIGSPCSADNNRDERNKFRSLDSARFDSEAERSLQTIYHLELWRNFGSARNRWPRHLIRLDWNCTSSPGPSIAPTKCKQESWLFVLRRRLNSRLWSWILIVNAEFDGTFLAPLDINFFTASKNKSERSSM